MDQNSWLQMSTVLSICTIVECGAGMFGNERLWERLKTTCRVPRTEAVGMADRLPIYLSPFSLSSLPVYSECECVHCVHQEWANPAFLLGVVSTKLRRASVHKRGSVNTC